jgi:hypothetical protein
MTPEGKPSAMPILIATRNDALQGIVDATPPERRDDLVFMQARARSCVRVRVCVCVLCVCVCVEERGAAALGAWRARVCRANASGRAAPPVLPAGLRFLPHTASTAARLLARSLALFPPPR